MTPDERTVSSAYIQDYIAESESVCLNCFEPGWMREVACIPFQMRCGKCGSQVTIYVDNTIPRASEIAQKKIEESARRKTLSEAQRQRVSNADGRSSKTDDSTRQKVDNRLRVGRRKVDGRSTGRNLDSRKAQSRKRSKK